LLPEKLPGRIRVLIIKYLSEVIVMFSWDLIEVLVDCCDHIIGGPRPCTNITYGFTTKVTVGDNAAFVIGLSPMYDYGSPFRRKVISYRLVPMRLMLRVSITFVGKDRRNSLSIIPRTAKDDCDVIESFNTVVLSTCFFNRLDLGPGRFKCFLLWRRMYVPYLI
jgi:hypothetical protein